MKISALNKLISVTRDAIIPVAVSGQTLSVTVGQLADILTSNVVLFYGSAPSGLSVTVAPGNTVASTPIVYDPTQKQFYAAFGCTFDADGNMTNATAYYEQWDERGLFYDENNKIRTNCIYLAENGGLYKFNGTDLISAGLTDAQTHQLKLATPIRVDSEEEMERMINDGETEEGQIYYTPEE